MAKLADNVEKRDVRLQIFVTQAMDNKLDDISEIMGMSKNELCRMAIGNLAMGYEKTIDILKDSFQEEIAKMKN